MLNRISPECQDRGSSPTLQAGYSRGRGKRVLWALLLLVLPLAAQSPELPGMGAGGPLEGRDGVTSGIEAHMQARRIAQLNQIRQKAMVGDAEKLVRLAQELNEDANAGGAKLSQAERMHKASEIEKLAKQVKDKMTYSVGQPTELSLPFATVTPR